MFFKYFKTYFEYLKFKINNTLNTIINLYQIISKYLKVGVVINKMV